MYRKIFAISLLLAMQSSLQLPAFADDTIQSSTSSSSSSSSSSETVEQSGVMGIRNSNKFAPKYKERIETYKNQIEMGLTKGWLSKEDGDKFTTELKRLAELEASVSAKGYIKADVDDLDKQLTKFNIEFTNAGQKKPAAAPAASSTASSPAPAKTESKPAAKVTTTAVKPVTKGAPKKAAKPTAKSSAKKK